MRIFHISVKALKMQAVLSHPLTLEDLMPLVLSLFFLQKLSGWMLGRYGSLLIVVFVRKAPIIKISKESHIALWKFVLSLLVTKRMDENDDGKR